MSRPGESRSERAPSPRCRRRGLDSGMKSLTAAAMTRPSHSGNSRTSRPWRSSAVSNGQHAHALGGGQARRPGQQRDSRSAIARGRRQREAHLAARAIGDEADGVDRLPRGPGRDEQPQALEVAALPGREAPGRLDDRGGLGHASDALAPRGEKALGRPDRDGAARGEHAPRSRARRRGPTWPSPSRARAAPVRGAPGSTSRGSRRPARWRACRACAPWPARRGAGRIPPPGPRARPRRCCPRPRPPCAPRASTARRRSAGPRTRALPGSGRRGRPRRA